VSEHNILNETENWLEPLSPFRECLLVGIMKTAQGGEANAVVRYQAISVRSDANYDLKSF
jgi:hypothetical protein